MSSPPRRAFLAQVRRLARGRTAQLTELDSKSSIIEPALRALGASRGRRPMHVKNILSAKGSNVVSIEPTATLETAVRTLAEHKIGALLVLGPDRRIMGILSERDIVRVMAERGASALTQPLASVMTRKVVTCSQSDTVDVLMQR